MAQASRLAGNGQSAIQRNIRSGTRRLRVTPPIDAANDWAIARLAEPVCRAGGLALSPLSREEVSLRAEAGGVFQIAMHRDVSPGGVVWGGPCSFARSFPQASEQTIEHDFADAPSILMHTCDTGAGSSGSPLLIDGANGPEVVGLNVGTYVLSRTSSSSSTQGGEDKSQPITNTAIETARFRPAAETFTLATSALGDDRTERRDAKAAAAKGRLAR
jgi:protease YdgD